MRYLRDEALVGGQSDRLLLSLHFPK